MRKKKLRGIQWYRRKFRIDYNRLYLHYLSEDNPITKQLYMRAPNKLFRYKLSIKSTSNVFEDRVKINLA